MQLNDDDGTDEILAAVTVRKDKRLFHPADEVIDPCVREMPIGIRHRLQDVLHAVADERQGPVEEIRYTDMIGVQFEN